MFGFAVIMGVKRFGNAIAAPANMADCHFDWWCIAGQAASHLVRFCRPFLAWPSVGLACHLLIALIGKM
jgi:hypothetical protein